MTGTGLVDGFDSGNPSVIGSLFQLFYVHTNILHNLSSNNTFYCVGQRRTLYPRDDGVLHRLVLDAVLQQERDLPLELLVDSCHAKRSQNHSSTQDYRLRFSSTTS